MADIDRRIFMASGGLLAFFPSRLMGQLPSQVIETMVDGGHFLHVPKFSNYQDNLNPVALVSGYRPLRTVGSGVNAVRLECETELNNPLIIHNYGHCGGGVTLSLGCAHYVKEFISQRISNKNINITVVGAGIIGLTTAFELKRAGFKNITIRARAKSSGSFGSPQTVSDIAGGQFEPAGIDRIDTNIIEISDSSNADDVSNPLDMIIAQSLKMLSRDRGKSFDIFRVNGSKNIHIYTPVRNYTTNKNMIGSKFYKTSALISKDEFFRSLMEDSLFGLRNSSPNGVVAPFKSLQAGRGTRDQPVMLGAVNTILINVPRMIENITAYLESERDSNPVKFAVGKKHTINSFEELKDIRSDVIINCSGLGGIVLGGPSEKGKMCGVYGALAILNEQVRPNNMRYLYSGFGYVFPRSTGTIVGGAWEENRDHVRMRSHDEVVALSREDISRYFDSILKADSLRLYRCRKMIEAMDDFFNASPSINLNRKYANEHWMAGYDQAPCPSDGSTC